MKTVSRKKAVGGVQRAVRKKRARKKSPTPVEGSDYKPVLEPRGGYAHKGRLDNPYPTVEEITSLGTSLGADYPKGKVPAAVMYGRRQVVLSQMLAAQPTSEIISVCGRQYGMSETMTRYLIHEIRTLWRSDMDEQQAYARAEVVTRLKRDLASMRAEKFRPWNDIARHEKLLAEVEGTKQPIKVSVIDANETTRDALMVVLGGMSESELAEFVKGEPQIVETTGY